MDVIGKIIQNAADPGKPDHDLFLMAIDEAQIFRDRENVADFTVSKINSLLQSHVTKVTGFNLIIEFVTQCEPHILDERGLKWFQLAERTCTTRSPASAVSPAFSVIASLVRRSKHSPDFLKTITASMLQKVFDSALKVAETDATAALDCMIDCMLTLPGYCGPSKGHIEQMAVRFIESSNQALVTRAANCLFLLQACKIGGEHGQLHRKYFVEYQKQLLELIHQQLDVLFKDFDEGFDDDKPEAESKLKIPVIVYPDEPIRRVSKVVLVVINLLKFLNVTLVAPYPGVKIIQSHHILNVIKRGLAVHPKLVGIDAIVDQIFVATLLPQVHVELLGTLDVLIETCKTNLRPVCAEILNLYHTTLSWSSDGESVGAKKRFTRVREAIYASLKLWLDIMGRSSLVEDIADTVILAIIDDSSPYKNEVKLQVQMDGNRNLSRKAKKRLIKSQNESTQLAQSHANPSRTFKSHQSDKENVNLCISALSCCISLLETLGCILKPTQVRTLHQHIIQQSLTLDLNSRSKDSLFYGTNSRRTLYHALFALTSNPHHLVPPPMQYVLDILTDAAQSDEEPSIRELCQSKVFVLGRTLRPQRPTLYFEADVEELADAVKDLRGDRIEVDEEVPVNGNAEVIDVDMVDEDVQIVEEAAGVEMAKSPDSETSGKRKRESDDDDEEEVEEDDDIEVLPTPAQKVSQIEKNRDSKGETTTVEEPKKFLEENNAGDQAEVDVDVEEMFKDFVAE